MKLSLECRDLLLERSLELFLRDFLVLQKDCDFLITDEKIKSPKPLFIISPNSPFLSLPFSREQLLEALADFDAALKHSAEKIAEQKRAELEARIEAIAEEFKREYEGQINAAIAELKNRLIKTLQP